MNRQRRKDIERALALIDEAKAILESAREDEDDYYDKMPEGIQDGEKGQRASDVVDALQEAVDACEEVVEAANRAVE